MRPRVIPCLLLQGRGLVKTVRFRQPRYVGDPVNAVRIFNEKDVDELLVLDIAATAERRQPPVEIVRELASECFMPLAFGGGVRDLASAERLFAAGVEKVVVNTAAVERPQVIEDLSRRFGAQSVVVSIDVGRSWWGRERVLIRGGRVATRLSPVDHARDAEARGAGEIFLTDISRDGTGDGYDLDLVGRVSAAVTVPVVACGGAGRVEDLADAVKAGASAAAAGSLFVFTGRQRAVLINYPSPSELDAVFP